MGNLYLVIHRWMTKYQTGNIYNFCNYCWKHMVTSIPSWVYHILTFSTTQLVYQNTLSLNRTLHRLQEASMLIWTQLRDSWWRLGWRPALDLPNGTSSSLLLELGVCVGALNCSASVSPPEVTDWAPDMTTTSNSLLLGDLLALAEATGPRWRACSLLGGVWTAGCGCSHIFSSALPMVLGRPKPSAGLLRYTFWSPWHWTMRYILSLNTVSCFFQLDGSAGTPSCPLPVMHPWPSCQRSSCICQQPVPTS